MVRQRGRMKKLIAEIVQAIGDQADQVMVTEMKIDRPKAEQMMESLLSFAAFLAE
jgi:hypothetical protein